MELRTKNFHCLCRNEHLISIIKQLLSKDAIQKSKLKDPKERVHFGTTGVIGRLVTWSYDLV